MEAALPPRVSAPSRAPRLAPRGGTLLLALLAGALAVPVARAQVVLDPGFSSDTVGAGNYAPGLPTDYLIREAYGRRSGDNLFHRFVRFDVGAGQSATFVEDAPGSGIRRVIAHVDATSASRIDGVLRSTIPNADLLFFNPRGLVFGPTSSLDLQGAFHASSADHVRFSDGVRFGRDAGGAAVTISAAEPAAWGFLGSGAGTLHVDAARLRTPEGHDFSLVGGPIRVDGPGTTPSPNLAAPSATLSLYAIDGAGESPFPSVTPADLELLPATGPITLASGAVLDASGRDDQILVVRAGSLAALDTSIIAHHRGAAGHPGDAVDIAVRDAFELGDATAGTTASLWSLASRDAPAVTVGDGGDVRIRADRFASTGVGSDVVVGTACALALACAPGSEPSAAGGDLSLDVDTLSIREGAAIVVANAGRGRGGDLRVTAREASIGSDAEAVDATLFSLNNGFHASGSTPPPGQDARGGDLVLDVAERLALENRGTIRSRTNGNGRGGDVVLRVGDLELVRTAAAASQKPTIQTITAGTNLAAPEAGEGRAGDLRIEATGDVSLRDGELVTRSRFDPAAPGPPANGLPGRIDVQAPTGTLRVGEGAIVSSSLFAGTGSPIELTAERIEVGDGGVVQSTLNTTGRAGDIRLVASDVEIRGRGPAGAPSAVISAPLRSADLQPDGASGSIEIEGRRLRVADGGLIRVNGSREGAAGSIRVGQNAPLASVVIDGGTLEANTNGPGASGGDIAIAADTIVLDDGARISASNLIAGGTGSIRLDGERLSLRGDSEIAATSGLAGVGGNISIRMRERFVGHEARLTTDSQGGTPTNRGGDLEVQSALVVLSETALRASAPAGAGGRIQIVAGRFLPAATNPPPDATGGTSARNGTVSILAAQTSTANVVARPSVAYEDPGQRLARACESRTEAQGSLYVLPRPFSPPPEETSDGTQSKSLRRARRIAENAHALRGEPAEAARRQAAELYRAVLVDDAATPRERVWAEGGLARLALEAGRPDEALALARRALRAASLESDPLAEQRFGRLLAEALDATGDRAGAIETLRRAAQLGEALRRDRLIGAGRVARAESDTTTTHAGDAGDGGLDAAGTTNRLLAMLLDAVEAVEAEAGTGGAEPLAERETLRQARLREIRDWLEIRRSAELEDHFGDACLADGDRVAPDAIGGALVLYPILLEDRVALLTGFEGRFDYRRAPIAPHDLLAHARAFRRLLEKRTTRQYLRPARRLYDALIRPIESALEAGNVDTLVVVPDGLLRTVPFAALHDRETGRYLVDLKPVALVPSLRLTDPTPLAERRPRVLAAGLESAVGGFERLDHTREEIERLREHFPEIRVLFDEDFEIEALARELRTRPYSIVHFATHGRVSGDGRDSFLLAYDGRLGLDRMAEMIATTRFRRETPLELLTLSACETAAGDEDAALGLAGVALRSGARSALATLWPVNDEATTRLIDAFYRELTRPNQTRAGALRAAQRAIRESPRFDHPGYWAPFLMISSWL